MGKKKQLEKACRRAIKKQLRARDGFAASAVDGADGGYGTTPLDAGLLGSLGLPASWRSGRTEQFLLGAVIGAAAAYVLSDEKLRGNIVKSAIRLYSNFAGGFEELKEQVGDLKAEIEAERGSDA